MSFIAWLTNIGRSQRRQDATTAQLHAQIASLPDDDAFGMDAPLTAAMQERAPRSDADVRALVDVLALLPPRQRRVMVLNLAGLTPPEIAAKLGVTNEAAIRDLARAFSVIRERVH